mgnify:CR=1 FL=1
MVFCECQKDTFLQSIYTIVIVIVSYSAIIGTIERELSMDTMKILMGRKGKVPICRRCLVTLAYLPLLQCGG